MSENKHDKPQSSFSSSFANSHEEHHEQKPHKHEPRRENSEQLSKLETAVTEMKDALVRSLAENENLKKRHERDLESTIKFGATNILKDLIEPFEQLFMALSVQVHSDVSNHDFFKAMINGIEITRKAFEKAFEKHGLIRVYPKGHKFDHNLHQAISQIKAEGVASGTVIDVVQAGYTLHERTIKPAMVVVAL